LDFLQSSFLFNAYDHAAWHRHHLDASGGYVVVCRQRMAHSLINKNESAKYAKELAMAMVFAQNGYRIEMLEEVPRIPSPDVRIDGMLGDLKRLHTHNNILREAKSAIRSQGAEVVLFSFAHETTDIHAELQKLYRRYNIHALYVFDGKNKVHQNFPD
jgi:hypothetical protein